MPVKPFVLFLLLSAAAFAQTAESPKIVTFSRADTEHCKVVVVSGKPLLQTTYNGTTVAITVPQNWRNGEFSVFVAVAQVAAGEVQINPKEISALYADPDHTRFRWFDKAHDLDTLATLRAAGPGGLAGSNGDSKNADPPPNHSDSPHQPRLHSRAESSADRFRIQS